MVEHTKRILQSFFQMAQLHKGNFQQNYVDKYSISSVNYLHSLDHNYPDHLQIFNVCKIIWQMLIKFYRMMCKSSSSQDFFFLWVTLSVNCDHSLLFFESIFLLHRTWRYFCIYWCSWASAKCQWSFCYICWVS